MKEDRVRLRIDSLSNPVRAYLALGFALNNQVLEDKAREDLRAKRFEMLDKFTPLQKAELVNFGEFMAKGVKKR